MDGNPTNIRFVQARQYQKGRRSHIRGVTIHSMEAPEKGSTAEGTAQYFRTITRPASAHYNIDVDSIVQSVRDGDTAYHAPGASHCHLGFEHAGYARQSPADWHDPYSWAMLQRSAALLRKKSQQYKFPIKYIGVSDLRQGRFDGVTTHNEVSKAFGKSSHWDPGPGFPMEQYLSMARNGAHTVEPAPATIVLRRGAKDTATNKPVAFLQAMLTILAPVRINTHWKKGGGRISDPVGTYGASTEEAVRELQRFGRVMADQAKLPKSKWPTVDGIAGKEVAALIAFWVPKVLKK